MNADALQRQFGEAIGHRANFETLWRETNRYFRPAHRVTTERVEGARVDTHLLDSSGVWAAETAVAGLFTFVTPPTSKWLVARAEDDRVNNDRTATAWLSTVRDLVFQVMTRLDGGLYALLPGYYRDLLVSGGSWIFVDVQPDRIRFLRRPIGEMYTVDDAEGQPRGTFREYELEAHQAKEAFNIDRKVRVLHYIGHEELDDAGSPVVGVHIVDGIERKRTKYRDFPFVIDRWSKEPDECYGRGPGTMTLGDAKELQAIALSVRRGVQKIVDPPMLVNKGFFGKKTPAFDAGSILFVNRTIGGGKEYEMLETRAEPAAGENLAETIRTRIYRTFYVDALRELGLRGSSSPLKAAEVYGRREEVFRVLGPVVLERQVNFVQKIAELVYKVLDRQRLLPEVPAVLRGERFNFEFASTAALAMRRSEVDDYLGFMTAASPLFQVDPNATKTLDTDAILNRLAVLYGIFPGALKEREVVEAQIAQEQQMAQAAALTQVAQGAGDAAQSLAAVGM